MELAGGHNLDRNSTKRFCAFHLRVVKMFQMTLPYSQNCADQLFEVVTQVLHSRNISSVYIATDLIPEVDIYSETIAPYVKFIRKLADRFVMIQSVERMDPDRDFLDQLLCTKADLFLYTRGISANTANNCTSWSSHYTDWIMANRPQDLQQNNDHASVNLSPLLWQGTCHWNFASRRCGHM